MPIDRAKFDELIDEGFTVDEIVEFEKKRQSESKPTVNPYGDEEPEEQTPVDLTSIFSSSSPVPNIDEGKIPSFMEIMRNKNLDLGQKISRVIPTKTEDLIKSQKEAYGPVAQGANSALFGFPKFAAGKISPELKAELFPEQSTLLGKVGTGIMSAGGLLEGGGMQAGRFLSKYGIKGLQKISPKAFAAESAKVGLKAERGAVSARQKAVLLRNSLRSGIEGGTVAGTQIFDEDTSLSKQLFQAAGGATLGAGFSMMGQGLSKLGRNIKSSKKSILKSGKERIERIGEKETRESNLLLEQTGLKKSEELKKIDESIKETSAFKKETLFK